MCTPTQKSHVSSNEFAVPLVLAPSRGRWLDRWWLALHAVLLATVGAVAAPVWLKAAAVLALCLHAWRCRPPGPPLLLLGRDGFALPAAGRFGIGLLPGTAWASGWVRLRGRDDEGTVDIVLLRDQLDDLTWRALQARLRRGGIVVRRAQGR